MHHSLEPQFVLLVQDPILPHTVYEGYMLQHVGKEQQSFKGSQGLQFAAVEIDYLSQYSTIQPTSWLPYVALSMRRWSYDVMFVWLFAWLWNVAGKGRDGLFS